MNTLFILFTAIVVFGLAYRFYGGRLAELWGVDDKRVTPAYRFQDGKDYIPAKNWFVLFGHHFSSIAGAGPIVGPVIAVCLWGWLPALIWVVAGSIFLGGVHDFGSLMISVREDGRTIGDIAAKAISAKAKMVLSVFTWLALILVIAVFAYLGADTFVKQPGIVLPSLGIIPVAILVGLGLYRFDWPPAAVTLGGLAVLGLMIVGGRAWPISGGENALTLWISVLLVYAFIASIVPVNLLLQPRDYLCSFLLIGGLLLAVLGLLVSHPTVNTPAFIANPGNAGALWPMMFITIACGANSGFHSLIASGTTSKQLPNENCAQRIGYGGMILEGLLATIVILLIVGGFSASEFQRHLQEQTSPVNLYGLGFGAVTAPLLKGWGVFLALTILNAFILTTLDSATRITRYITEELFGLKNRFLATGLIVGLAGWLALGKDNAQTPLWKIIWPAFGASNQLVAALALIVISAWLLSERKRALIALLPAGFMLVTSLTALIFLLIDNGKSGNGLLAGIAGVLIVSAIYLAVEAGRAFGRYRRFNQQREPKPVKEFSG